MIGHYQNGVNVVKSGKRKVGRGKKSEKLEVGSWELEVGRKNEQV